MKISVPGFGKKKETSLGFWQRFVAVFTPDFLSRLGKDKEEGRSWAFWFLSNFFLVLIPFIAIGIFASIIMAGFPNNAINEIPSEATFEMPDGSEHNIKNLFQNFSFTINENFELETENIPDPLIMYVVETEKEDANVVFVNDVNEIDENAELVFVLDTKKQTTDADTISHFKNALYLLHDQFVATDQDDHNVEIIRYADTIGGDSDTVFPFTLDLATISEASPIISKIVFTMLVVLFVMVYFFFAVIRLVSSLFWALVFWGVGEIVKIKDWNFEKSFMAMLHFSFVTMLLCPLFLYLGLTSFLSAVIMLSVLFGMNFYNMKKA